MVQFSAYLPLKAHSQRVKNKNLRLFANEPLFFHILKTLCSLSWVSEVVVNSDSEHIFSLIESFNKKLVLRPRPKELCGDHITMNSLIHADLDLFKESFVLQTHATNPLLSANTLQNAYQQFLEKSSLYDSMFSVNTHQSRFYDGEIKPLNHDLNILIPTQDLNPVFEENSCFYFFSKESFKKSKNRIGKKTLVYSVPKTESIDIDTEEDFFIAEALYLRLSRLRPHQV